MRNDTTFKLRLPESELADWHKKAEAADLSLAAWIRERCNGMTPEQAKRGVALAVASIAAIPSRSPSLHTAESNWRTCLCGTCVKKRKEHGL